MLGIAASRLIAPVQNMQALGNSAIGHFPGQAMGADGDGPVGSPLTLLPQQAAGPAIEDEAISQSLLE
jgi:hypothetical protein